MRIRLNGADHELPEGSSVRDLLAGMGLEGVLVAVERNEQIVPRAKHAEILISEGDALEVVHFVGGG